MQYNQSECQIMLRSTCSVQEIYTASQITMSCISWCFYNVWNQGFKWQADNCLLQCEAMGLTGGVPSHATTSGPGPIWSTEIYCPANYSTVQNCTLYFTDAPDCSNADVALECGMCIHIQLNVYRNWFLHQSNISFLYLAIDVDYILIWTPLTEMLHWS